jgi:hypothetical protein
MRSGLPVPQCVITWALTVFGGFCGRFCSGDINDIQGHRKV